MKKTAFLFLLNFFLVFSLSAQLDRSQRPQPGPAPEIQLGDFESFTMDNGMKVIVVENHQVPVVSFQLTLDIDPVMEGDAVGYVDMAGSMLRQGTLSRSKQEIDESIDFIGGNISTYSTGIYASSLTKHQQTLLELMSDILLNPSFPEEELERLVNQSLSGLATVKTNANAMAANVARSVVYGPEHPYGQVTTPESLENITMDLIKDYYNTNFKPNVAYMVIVGDIKLDEARQLMNQYFSQWEPAEVPARKYATPQPPAGNKVAFADRTGAVQSVVSVGYPIELTPGHPDAIKASVMNSILGGGVFSGRLMQNLREDKGYTYGARSSLSNDPLVGRFSAGAEVRNAVTDSTVTEIFKEMRRLIEEPVDEKTMELTLNFLSGEFARSLESPRTIANFALYTALYDLPEDYYANYLKKLQSVTPEDVQQMAAKYMKPENAWVVVAGNKDEVAEKLVPLTYNGEVEFYDAFGRPASDDDLRPVAEGVTIDTVLNNYFEAIGGKENLERIQDLKQKMTTSIMGQNLTIEYYQKRPNLLLVETSMGGMVMSKQIFNGEKAVITSPMGNQEFTEGPEFEMIKKEATLNSELRYKEFGISKNLLGIETVQGEDAYKVEVIAADGTKSYEYYDVETGYKIQTENAQGTSTFGDYQPVAIEVKGEEPSFFGRLFGKKAETKEVQLYFPSTMSQQMGPQTLEMKVTEIEVNSGIEDEKFAVS